MQPWQTEERVHSGFEEKFIFLVGLIACGAYLALLANIR